MKTKTGRMLTGLAALIAAVAAGQAQYAFTTLECPLAKGNGTYPQHMEGTNVVGAYWDSNNVAHGFLYDGTNWTTLDNPHAGAGNGQGTYLEGISGTNIVGEYLDSAGASHGFIHKGTNWTTLDHPLGGTATGQGTFLIDISGTNIVGYYIDSSGNRHALLYNSTTFTTLDPPGAVYSEADGIFGTNIVGTFSTDGFLLAGFLYNGATYEIYSNPLGTSGTAFNGVSGTTIVGVFFDGSVKPHGFLYVLGGTNYTTLDEPLATGPNGATYPIGISGNTVAGSYYAPTGNLHGFLATTNLSLTLTRAAGNLTVSWPHPSLGWTLQQNLDLNTTNWTNIAGASTDTTNRFITIMPTRANAFFRLHQQ